MFACNIPFAIERNCKRSVAGYRNGRHGDAAFAGYSIMAGFPGGFEAGSAAGDSAHNQQRLGARCHLFR
jgi:hypothetical protein